MPAASASPNASRFGVYVHFPYCLSKCPYCDFASTVVQNIPEERYLEAILRELEARAEQAPAREVHSIYLGGGTPSLWHPRLVARLLEELVRRFAVSAD